MRHLTVTLHLIGLRMQDMLEQAGTERRTHSERGSTTIENVAWAVAIIAIVAIAVAAIRAYITSQVGKLS